MSWIAEICRETLCSGKLVPEEVSTSVTTYIILGHELVIACWYKYLVELHSRLLKHNKPEISWK